MFYYIYQVTNKVNDKIYVGVHKTEDLSDGYMGSGKVIRAAITKHGFDNFTKVILETFEDSKSMYARETEIVDDEFLARPDVYNLRRGGAGGFDYINKNPELFKDIAIKNHWITIKATYKKEDHHGYGKKRPEHSVFMKSIGFGKNKTPEHIENHRISWNLATKDNPIRAKNWVVVKNNEHISIKNLKMFCRNHEIHYLRFYHGVEISGYRLVRT